jgi:hypothetical protein
MSSTALPITNSTFNINKMKGQLHNDILKLVEEELYQRRNGKFYSANNINSDRVVPVTMQKGGGAGIDMFIPGKFDVIRHSMELPLDVAIRGSIARQKLYIKEKKL